MADPFAAVGERAVGGHEVDGPHLGDAQREREARVRLLGLEDHPEVLGAIEDVVRLVDGHRLDRGDVQGELERVPDPDRSALEVVGVVGRVPATEVGPGVHQHRAGRERAVVDRGGVVEGLERRSGLAEPVADDVVLRLELGAAPRGVVAWRTPTYATSSPVW